MKNKKAGWAIKLGDMFFYFFILMISGEIIRTLQRQGILFVREPAVENWGTVAVFEDLYGNLWDLIEPKN